MEFSDIDTHDTHPFRLIIKHLKKPPLKTVIKLMTVGTLSGMTSLLYYASMQTVPASIAIILLFQFVWVGVLYKWIFDRKKPTVKIYITLVLTLIGAMFAADVFHGKLTHLSPFGLFLGLCSAFTYAGLIYASGKVSVEISPWLRSLMMVTGSMILVFSLFPPSFLVSGLIPNDLWWVGLLVGILGTVVPTLCFTFGAPKISSGLATIFGSVELPVAVFMAWVFFQEDMNFLQWFGVLLILVAISIEEISRKWKDIWFSKKRAQKQRAQ